MKKPGLWTTCSGVVVVLKNLRPRTRSWPIGIHWRVPWSALEAQTESFFAG